jgi:hypothetical protein
MKQRIFFTAIAATIAGLGATPVFSQSNDGAQVIFTNDKLTVIDAKGIERTVKQGEFIQPGERVLTPPGVIGQIRLPDGTLLGARPGTDLKLEATLKTLGKNVLVLNEGNVRVINIEPSKGPKPLPMDVISPISTMQLTGGDGEAMHVKQGSKQTVESGTYNRLQLGAAVVRNDKGELPLPPMQPVFGSKLGVPLQPIAFLPISLVKLQPVLTTNLFAPTLSTTTLTTDLRSISPTLATSLTGCSVADVADTGDENADLTNAGHGAHANNDAGDCATRRFNLANDFSNADTDLQLDQPDHHHDSGSQAAATTTTATAENHYLQDLPVHQKVTAPLQPPRPRRAQGGFFWLLDGLTQLT